MTAIEAHKYECRATGVHGRLQSGNKSSIVLRFNKLREIAENVLGANKKFRLLVKRVEFR